MPSIADSRKHVQESLDQDAGPDHDAILSSLQHEIDKHNLIKSDTEEHLRRRRRRAERRDADEASGSGLRFRFKDGTTPRERHSRRRHTRQHRQPSVDHSDEAAHPFPREPASPSAPADDAFLSSLLDALADDEAAAYWESVYSQPIHAYSRPSVQTAKGELEEMNDEQYAAWVKEKMWEKQHPEIMIEREKMARKRQEEEDELKRRKADFIRRREKEAWTRASTHKSTEDHDYVFDFDSARNTREYSTASINWRDAWTEYLSAWNRLKQQESSSKSEGPPRSLPRPTLPSKPLTRPHIEDFMRNMPLQDGRSRQHVLKVERVRWHPDKIQQLFHGQADEATLKTVTAIFQIIDAIWADENSRRT